MFDTDSNPDSDFELQGENTSRRIYSHTITGSWNEQLDNVMKSEIDIQGKPDLITTPTEESSLSSIGNLFTFQDGSLHPVKITISGITITMIIMITICLLCYWKRNPKICNNIFNACTRKHQTQKSLLIDNVLNSIKQELNSSLEQTQLELASFQSNSNMGQPPSPPVLVL